MRVGQVERFDDAAAHCIAAPVLGEAPAKGGDGLRRASRKVGREPARRQHLLDERAISFPADERLALAPDLRIHFRRGGDEHQPVEHPWMAEREGLRRHAAERQPDDMRPRHAERGEQSRQVVGEVVDRRRPVEHLGTAVAAGVVTQAAIAPGECRHLRIPHLQGRADGMGKDDRPARLRARPSRRRARRHWL